jgi:hypothetical protein
MPIDDEDWLTLFRHGDPSQLFIVICIAGKILPAGIYLIAMEIKPEFNEACIKFFPKNPPARNCVAVAGIDDGLYVEIEV